MDRRAFLTMTTTMATLASYAHAEPERHLGAVWIPTQEEVDTWREYWSLYVKRGVQDFHATLQVAFKDEPDGYWEKLTPENRLSIKRTQADTALLEHAERAWKALEDDRMKVAHANVAGYDAGRAGQPRHNVAFKHACNEGYAWFNYWDVGNKDRLWALGKKRGLNA